jgi:hypothetical protein
VPHLQVGPALPGPSSAQWCSLDLAADAYA